MSIKVKFGISSANPITINKDEYITWKTNFIDCDLFQAFNIQKPTFKLHFNSTIMDCNYIYIQDFNRYYFMKEPDLIPGTAMIIQADEDYLYTNKTEILNLNCNIRRQEYFQDDLGRDKFLMDNKITKTGKSLMDVQPFKGTDLFNKNVESEYCYVVSVIGGIAAT